MYQLPSSYSHRSTFRGLVVLICVLLSVSSCGGGSGSAGGSAQSTTSQSASSSLNSSAQSATSQTSSSSLNSSAVSSVSVNQVVMTWDDWTAASASDGSAVYLPAYSTGGVNTGSAYATFNGGVYAPVQTAADPRIATSGSDRFVRQSYNKSFYIDFVITADSSKTSLTQFSFDAVMNTNTAPKNWTLSVEPFDDSFQADSPAIKSEITMGTVGRQAFSVGKDVVQTFTFDLSKLADHDLGAGGKARLRLSTWGAATEVAAGNFTRIDNVRITAEKPAVLEAKRPGQGDRALWLKGVYGLEWKPDDLYNGRAEGVYIDAFLAQVKQLTTLDYIKINLSGANLYSPVHSAPHAILESLWHKDDPLDVDSTGKPIANLVVPRASQRDPFADWLDKIKLAGLKANVYVNSSNMLLRAETDTPPSEYPNVTARWKTYCDTNEAAQAFLNSKTYYKDAAYPNRQYMFCYAEFVLREYAIRYGNKISAWIFDSAQYIYDNGDGNYQNGNPYDQRLFQAFSEATRAGNPDVAVAFNLEKGFHVVTLYDDYQFGHPFGGGKLIGGAVPGEVGYGPSDTGLNNYDRNYRMLTTMADTHGYVTSGTGSTAAKAFTWDDRVVGHFYPPMSTTSWNSGNVAALTNADFNLWNEVGLGGGGAITWGAALVRPSAASSSPDYTVKDWAMAQLIEMDAHLKSLGISVAK